MAIAADGDVYPDRLTRRTDYVELALSRSDSIDCFRDRKAPGRTILVHPTNVRDALVRVQPVILGGAKNL